MNKTFGLWALRRTCATRLSSILAVIFAVAYLASVTVRAGVTISLYLDNNGNGGSPYYLMFANINTNALTPMPANTLFYIWSPSGSTNSGVHAEMDSTGFSADGSGGISYGTYQSLINDVTNEWTLMTIQGTTTNFYSFSFSGFTSNDFPGVTIVYPANNAGGVSFSPDFSWLLGPTNYTQLYVQVNSPDYSDVFNAYLPLNQTNWQTPGVLQEETNYDFSVIYNNFSSGVTSSVPEDAASAVFPGWASTSELSTYNDSQFIPGVSGTASTIGHTLIAHYAFDNGSLGQDSSGNGNDLNCYSTWGDNISQTFNTNAEAGAGAAEFYGESGMTPCDPSQSLTSWSNTLVGSYSISLWINTTNVVGNDGDAMSDYNGQSVFFADNNGEGSIPVGITGHKIAFFTGDPDNNQDTLHSLNSVTTGGYVHVVVTRNQITGEKRIYVNGTLDSADFGSTELLTGDSYSSIGGAYASAYVGLVDDVQIYSGVLEPAEVTNLFDNPGTTEPNVSPGSDILVAHYSFDNTANLGQDSSGNGYDLTYNGGDGVSASTQAKTGGGAADFDGNSFFSYNTAPAAILSTLAGDFTLSFWINTTEDDGNEGGEAYAGAGIVAADVPGQANDLVPAALDGGEIGFNTGPNDDTLNTFVDINDGNYHHVVITRSQATGQKQIYIDGVLNNSDADTTSLLNAPQLVAIGCQIDASQSNPANANPNNYFQGLLDDMQLYSVVLTSNQVAQLYANPGTVITPTGAPDFNGALDTTNLAWSTTGDTSWFVESTNTDGSATAAQSGSVTNEQSSTLSTTVTGPATIAFAWSSIANDPIGGFDYQFTIDGNEQDEISGDTSWYQDGPFAIPAGQHVLTWTVSANGDTDPTEAGFLTQVSYVPDSAPVITLNPTSITNSPGYQAGLLAGASGYPTPTWQWYHGSSLISQAMSPLLIAPGSGTPSVAGNYYAVASNAAGSVTTLTATVTFVEATPPPAWTVAVNSPFSVNDYYYGCSLDSTGNVYAADEFAGTNLIGTSTVVAGNGGDAAALVKESADGTSLLWYAAITNNGNGNARASAVATAPADGVYVSGSFTGTNSFGTNLLVDDGSGSIFLGYFTANGSNVWLKTIGGTGGLFTSMNCLVSDPSGNVTLAGVFSGTVNFGGTNIITASGQQTFVAQYNSAGALNWIVASAGFFNYLTYGGGDIYGTMLNASGSVTVGATSITTDRRWTLVALNNTNGQTLWLDGIGAASGQSGPSVIDDVPGLAVSGTNLYLVGTAYGSSATFGSFTVTNTGISGQYFVRFDTNGTAQVATGFGSQTTRPWAVAASASGDVYVSGDFDTASSFGGKILAAARIDALGTDYYGQAFVAKFDSNGNPLWANLATSSQLINFRGVAAASDGVWVSGFFQGFATLGSLYLDSSASYGNFYTIWAHSGLLAKIKDVGMAPVITQQPVSQTLQCGAYGFLNVTVTNNPEPVYYQWYENATNPIAGADTTALDFYPGELGESANYSVVVANAFGVVTSSVAVLVVTDTMPPVVTLNGSAQVITACPDNFVDPGATAYDQCAGVLPVTVSGSVSPLPGTNYLYYVATDPSGNSATNIRVVIVVPVTNPPVISLIGANPMQALVNGSFVDPGASAVDFCGNPLSVTATGSVNANVDGAYTITYTTTDGNGLSSTNTRTVLVEDAIQCVDAPSGLISWWTADGNAKDELGAHNGTLEPGATIVPGFKGEAFDIDGTNGYVDVGTWSPGTNWTIEAWVNASSLPSGRRIIAGGLSSCYDWAIVLNDGYFGVATRPSVSECSQTTESSLQVQTNTWYHVVGTCDGTTAKIYVNGVLQNSAPVLSNYTAATADAGIGGGYYWSGSSFAGLIDEVAIYNRALSAAEVGNIYNAGAEGKCTLYPAITSFSPTSGSVGNVITIEGANFYNVSNVLFNGTAASFTVGTGGELAAYVPTNATTGPITVVAAVGSVVTPQNFTVTTGAASCLPAPSGLTGWWPADGNALDAVARDDGTLENGVTYAPGEIGEAFSFDGTDGYVVIPASTNLNIGQGAGFSIEGWIDPSSVSSVQSVVEWYANYQYGVRFWIAAPTSIGAGGPGCLYADVMDNQGYDHAITSGPGLVVSNAFQHVGLTYDQGSGVASLYLNGALIARSNLGSFTPQTSYNLYFGTHLRQGAYFGGLMDDLSIYNRSLSSDEIGAIYNAGSIGKCPLPPAILYQPANVSTNEGLDATFNVIANGTPPLIYQWYHGSQPLTNDAHVSGATNQTLALTRVTSADTGNYWVAITNAFGNTNSTQASLVVTNVYDLQFLGVAGPPQAVSGEPLEINWSITNAGAATYNGTFHNQVFLSPNAAGSNSTYYGVFDFSGTIAPGQTINLSGFITPALSLSGDQWVVINTDANGQVAGGNGETNNLLVSAAPVDIVLQPLPALQMTGVTVPPSTYAGQPVTITWGVTNAGTGGTSTTRWNDGVWLSGDGQIDITSHFLGNVPNPSALSLGGSYVSSLTVTIPLQYEGNYYVVVQTDTGRNVTELIRTNDTLAGGPMQIQVPPLPELVPSIVAPPAAFSGQNALISWTVNNLGAGPTLQSSWLDAIYLSPTNIFDTNAVLLAYQSHNGIVSSGGSYSFTNYPVSLPVGISGNYYFLVVADNNQQVYELSRANSTVASSPVTEVLLTPPPDLVAGPISAPNTILSAHGFTVSNVVINEGASATPNYSWYDNYYLSPTTNLNFANAILLVSDGHYGALGAGQSYTNVINLTVPDGLTGTYYLFVDVDAGNQVFELNKTNNVGFDPSAITASAPVPDLVVTSLDALATVAPGSGVAVSWTVQNQGTIDTAVANWQDAVLLSTNINGANAVTLGTFGHTGLLNPGDSYTVTNQTVALPYGLSFGTYYLFVVADNDGSVYLGSNSVNQTSAPRAVTLYSPTADLSASDVDAPASVTGNQSFNVSWAVTNLGPGQTYAGYWYDSVYLSTNSSEYLATNTLPLAGDILMGGLSHGSNLAAGQSYDGTLDVVAPANISGAYTLYVLVDSSQRVVEDTIRSNNVAFATNQIVVEMAPPVLLPDLSVSQVSAPAQAFSSQSISVTYTVVNNGPGQANGNWYDSVYLSPDPYLDTTTALYLGNANGVRNLASDGQYTNTVAMPIPANLSGYFYVFVVANAGNNLPEVNFNNNALNAPDATLISIPPPADLVVTAVPTPTNSLAGEPASISYTVSNEGTNAAQGNWTDAVYLSTNGQWSADDILIGYVQQSGNIAAGSNYVGTLDADIPGVPPGNYYVVVRPDILDNLNENESASHNGSTTNTFFIDVPALNLDMSETSLLGQGQEEFFKVYVPAGQTLSVALNSDSPLSANQLYVSYGSIPGEVNFEYLGDNPSSADQQIIIPATQAGWYYILVLGDSVSGGSENASIVANAVQFSLDSVTPDQGGNGGNVTVQLQGGQFNAQTVATLLGPDFTAITGTTRSIASAAEMYATFNLQGAPTGTYSVQLTQPGNLPVVLNNAFTVTAGLGANLAANLNIPGGVRPGFSYTATLNYENTGDEDMPAPFFVITNSVGASMSLTSGGTFVTGMIKLMGIAQDGPAGILRPGVQYSLPVYFQAPSNAVAHTVFNFDLEHVNPNSTPVDWSIFLPPQPAAVPADAWAAVSSNLVLQIGPDMSHFVQALANDATFYSQENQRVYDVTKLFNLEMLKALNIVTPVHTLETVVDDTLPSPGLNLSFARMMPAAINRRFQIGPFGRGWTHTFEYSLTQPLTNMVDITPPNGSDRIFFQQPDLTWQALSEDNGVLQNTGGGTFTLTEADGSVSHYDSQGKLVAVQDTDGNQLTLAYSGGNLTSITHSDGQQMTFAYNSSGCISALTDSAGQTIQYHYDANGQHLLYVVNPGNVTNAYDYVPATGTSSDHALQSIAYPDGTHRYFTYDVLGRLSSTSQDNQSRLINYGYGSTGQIFETNAINEVTAFICGDSGQVLQRKNALGNIVALNYDSDTSVTEIQQPAGQSTLFGYDAKERRISSQNALGQMVSLGYTNLSRLGVIHDQRGMTTQFNYDNRGNPVQTVFPDLTFESAAYDAGGTVTNFTNRRGQNIQYTYNSGGQMMQKILPDGRVITYAYDARGNRTNITDSVQGAIAIGYDSRGLMTNILTADGRSFAFKYDNAGHRTQRASSDGYVLNYSYNAAGQLSSISDGASNQLVRYAYDAAGQLTSEAKGNGTLTRYAYDAAEQMIALTNYAPDSSVQSFFNYAYDVNGNCLFMTNNLGVTLYQYDLLGQLTGVDYPGGRQVTYAYDAAGNRTTMSDTGTNTAYLVNSVNGYTQAGGAILLYDADGNLTNRTDAYGTTAYQYDAENELVSVTTPTNGVWQYTYDALGRRTAMTHNGVTTYYQLDPAYANVAAEYDSNGNLIARYNEGLGMLSRIDGNGNGDYYSYDALGNTRELTGTNGAVLNSYDYDAFGTATLANETVTNEFQYVGRFGVTAEPTHLLFMKNRYYAPDLGRFESEDPIRFAGGLNLVKYVNNNPISGSDPLGLLVINDGDATSPGEAMAKLGGPPIQTVDVTGSVTDGGGVVGGFTISRNGVQVYAGSSTGEGNGAGVLFSTSTPTEGYNVAVTVSAPGGAYQVSFSGANADQQAKTFIANLGSSTWNGISTEFGPYIGSPGVTVSYYYVSPPLNNMVEYAANYWGDAIINITPKLMNPALFFVHDDTPPAQILLPGDPNQKTGPIGFGPNGLISATQPIPYTITFVNASSNTAPAHTITISDQLDPNLDPRTFRLTEVVLGTNAVQVPPNRSFLQTNLTLTTADGPVQVDVIVGVNVQSRSLFWTFTSIDPATGLPPSDPVLGLLPPDDSNHAGEARVSYTVTPLAGVLTGTSITNGATITFDNNPPITTPSVTNMLDAGTPESVMTVTNDVAFSNTFLVSWSGTDANGESGLASYNIYVSDDGGPFQLWLGNTTLTSATYNGQPGHTYAFYSIAMDNAGNIQLPPSQPGASVFISTNLPPVIAPITNVVVAPDHAVQFQVNATDPDGDQLTYSLGTNAPANAYICPTNGDFYWLPTRADSETTNAITVQVTDDGVPPLTTTQTFTVIVLDYLELDLGATNVFGGQTAALPVSLASSGGVTNLLFTVQTPVNAFTNWGLANLLPQVASATVQDFKTNILIALYTQPGQLLQGTQQIAQLSFLANGSPASSFNALPILQIMGNKPGSMAYSNYITHAGSVTVVNREPLLHASFTNQQQVLTLFGLTGTNYELQFTTNLVAPENWQSLFNYTQPTIMFNTNLNSTNPIIFYRLLEQ